MPEYSRLDHHTIVCYITSVLGDIGFLVRGEIIWYEGMLLLDHQPHGGVGCQQAIQYWGMCMSTYSSSARVRLREFKQREHDLKG